MSVKITDICIACGACIDECPVEAIVDDDDNPNDDGCYFVHSEKCVECVGHNDEHGALKIRLYWIRVVKLCLNMILCVK